MGAKKFSLAVDNMHFVTAWRLHFNLRPSELARRSGLTDSFLSQIEKGRSQPSLTTLHQIAKGLNIPVYMVLFDPERLEDKDDQDWVRIAKAGFVHDMVEQIRHSQLDLIAEVENMRALVEAKLKRQRAKDMIAHSKNNAA